MSAKQDMNGLRTNYNVKFCVDPMRRNKMENVSPIAEVMKSLIREFVSANQDMLNY